jgi:hypothetical protein
MDDQLAHLLNLAVGKRRSNSTKDRKKQGSQEAGIARSKEHSNLPPNLAVAILAPRDPPAILREARYWSGFLLSNDIPKIPLRCTSGSAAGALAACGGDAAAACGGGAGKLSHFIE